LAYRLERASEPKGARGNIITSDSDGTLGIGLSYSSDNTIIENNVPAQTYGIELYYFCLYNSIIGNKITENNRYGIMLSICDYNSIIGNNIAANNCGMYLYNSYDNPFYHNNFIDNIEQVHFYYCSYGNPCDDGYPSGGNYWSDYNGTDVYNGPYQNQTGSDGIGDTPYVIDSGNQDNYPLINNSTTARPLVGDITGGTPNPWDFVPDGKVDGKDIAIIAMCYGSAPGCTPPYIWNAHCDVNNDSKVDGEDIATVAIHFGEANFP
jgi:parallel beta-helix repeat protein